MLPQCVVVMYICYDTCARDNESVVGRESKVPFDGRLLLRRYSECKCSIGPCFELGSFPPSFFAYRRSHAPPPTPLVTPRHRSMLERILSFLSFFLAAAMVFHASHAIPTASSDHLPLLSWRPSPPLPPSRPSLGRRSSSHRSSSPPPHLSWKPSPPPPFRFDRAMPFLRHRRSHMLFHASHATPIASSDHLPLLS